MKKEKYDFYSPHDLDVIDQNYDFLEIHKSNSHLMLEDNYQKLSINILNEDSSSSNSGYDLVSGQFNSEKDSKKYLYDSKDFNYDFCDKNNKEMIPFSSMNEEDYLETSNWNIQFQTINNLRDEDNRINKLAEITKNFHINAKVKNINFFYFSI